MEFPPIGKIPTENQKKKLSAAFTSSTIKVSQADRISSVPPVLIAEKSWSIFFALGCTDDIFANVTEIEFENLPEILVEN